MRRPVNIMKKEHNSQVVFEQVNIIACNETFPKFSN